MGKPTKKDQDKAQVNAEIKKIKKELSKLIEMRDSFMKPKNRQGNIVSPGGGRSRRS